MRIIADLHIHSKHSRATSTQMDIENLDKWAKLKGINLLGTGDFTHPEWFSELRTKLEEADGGFYKISDQYKKEEYKDYDDIYFVPTAEISSIYNQDGKLRRIHNIIIAPSLEIVEKINEKLSKKGNLHSDGRPILGISAKEVAEIILGISKDCLVVPAHVWTPWFSLYGSMSGFDSIKDCFGEFAPQIHAIETGLSSDPAMNWRISELDKRAILSFSDSHSPRKIGREATIFNIEPNYSGLVEAVKSKDKSKIPLTIEFYPEEGKYHYTGHRKCGIAQSPEETKMKGSVCPACGRPLTIGVMHRVEKLADRPSGYADNRFSSYKKLVPLIEIIAEALDQGVNTQGVEREYLKFVMSFKNEFNVLMNEPIENLERINPLTAEGIKKVREGNVNISPGYDGEYGKVSIFGEKKELPQNKQTSIFDTS